MYCIFFFFYDVTVDTIDCNRSSLEIKMYFYFHEFSIVYIFFSLHVRTV